MTPERTTWDQSAITEASETPGEDGPARRRLSREAWPDIVAGFKEGKSMNALARDHGCTPSSIRHVLVKSGALETGPADAETEAPSPDAAPADAAPPAPEPTVPEPAPPAAPVTAAPAPAPVPAAPVAASAPAPAAEPAPAPARRLSLKPADPAPAQPRPAAAAPRAEAPRPAAPAALPAAPRDGEAVAARLAEAASALGGAWKNWCRQPGGQSEDESLTAALHVLRKAVARVEIEQASTRRTAPAGHRPLPKPAHRYGGVLTDDPDTAY